MKENDILIVKIRENCLMCDMTLQRLEELGVSYKTEITTDIAPILVKNGKMPDEDENNLEAMSVTKLRELAKEKGIKNYSKLSKAELLCSKEAIAIFKLSLAVRNSCLLASPAS